MNPIPLNFPAVVPLQEALSALKLATGRDWSRNEFFDAVVHHSLPMRAATPNGTRTVLQAFGQYVDAGLPDVGKRRLAVLLTRHVNDLLVHGQSETQLVALEPADPDYMPWPKIKLLREVLGRTSYTPDEWNAKWPDSDWHAGELMGESGLAFFEMPVSVTDETCRVPRETIVELIEVCASAVQSQQVVTAVTGSTVHKLRRNTLDPVIDMAILRASDSSSHAVFVALRDLALAEVPPLLGATDKGIRYTNDNNEIAHLTKDALRHRLKKRKDGTDA